ncbi:7018_t:CDS:1, partial [Dentiscutata heterogama]
TRNSPQNVEMEYNPHFINKKQITTYVVNLQPANMEWRISNSAPSGSDNLHKCLSQWLGSSSEKLSHFRKIIITRASTIHKCSSISIGSTTNIQKSKKSYKKTCKDNV